MNVTPRCRSEGNGWMGKGMMTMMTLLNGDNNYILTISKPCQLPFTLLFTDHSHKTLMM